MVQVQRKECVLELSSDDLNKGQKGGKVKHEKNQDEVIDSEWVDAYLNGK